MISVAGLEQARPGQFLQNLACNHAVPVVVRMDKVPVNLLRRVHENSAEIREVTSTVGPFRGAELFVQ